MSPFFSPRVLTLNFEGRAIRMLTARGETIEKWHTIELPPELMSGGSVHQPDQAAAELRSVISQLGIRPGKVVSSISGQRSIYRTLHFPRIKGEFLDGAVRRKIRQEITLPPEETDLSWKIVGQADGELAVYVVALPRELIDRQVETTRLAGLKPRVLDVKPLALLHAVNDEQGVIANLEPHGLTIVVIRDGLPGIVRTVPLPENGQTEGGRLDLLAQELRRTIKFFNESNKARPLPSEAIIYATGRDFDRPDSLDDLSARLDSSLELAHPPVRLPEGLPIGAYSVNLGLMLKRR